MSNTLYIVAAESNVREGIVEYANVGMTGEGRTPEERLRDGDYARKAGGGRWNVLAKFDIGSHADHAVHALLRRAGFVLNPRGTSNTEEVLFARPAADVVDVVARCVNELLSGVSRPDSYGMRPEQAECVEKASAYFAQGGTRFLVDAKMRFGKTHVTYQIAKRLGAQRVLIASYKTAVEDSWRTDLERHIDFEGQAFHRVDGGDRGPGVYFTSMQGVLADERAEEAKREWIYAVDWDLLVLDEEHYGMRSDNAKDVFTGVRAKRTLNLSGTPFQARLSGEFSDEQTFVWTYTDEQTRKREWDEAAGRNPYATLPEMRFLCYEHGDLVRRKAGRYADDEQFRISKLLATDDRGFINEAAVLTLLDLLADGGDEDESTTSPWHSEHVRGHARYMLDHTFWMLPSVASCAALKSLMAGHRFFGSFDVIDASGSNVTRVEEARGAIELAAALGRRSIVLSCGRFTEGVTVKQWGAVFFLDETASPAKYFQAAFRCQSPWAEGENIRKTTCFVVDLNPHRTLEMVYVQGELNSRSERGIAEDVRQFLRCAPIFLHGSNGIVQKDAEAVLQAGVERRSPVDRIGSLAAIDRLSNLSDEAARSLMGIDPAKAAALLKVVTESDVARGKVKEAREQKAKISRAEAAEVSKLQERIQTMLRRIPSYLWVTAADEQSCRDIAVRGDAELFEEEVGMSLSLFRGMLDAQVLDEAYLDSCIISFNLMERKVEPLFQLS